MTALEGDLERFHAADVLQLLHLAGATGRLECERTSERVDVTLEAGRPVIARTTGLAVRLGDVLVHRRVVTAAALEGALASQRERPDRRLGAVVLDLGLAERADVERCLGETLKRVLLGLMLWRAGRFRFVAGEHGLTEGVRAAVEIDRLILEGLHAADRDTGT